MNDLVIGLGEVGTAVYDLLKSKYDVEGYDIKTDNILYHIKYRVLNICIPYTEDFAENVRRYMSIHKPQYVFVWSSVPIGTCESISDCVVHTPVEGKHPHLLISLKRMTRWIGTKDADTAYFAENYFKELGVQTTIVPSSRFTEFLKLRSTSKYGINIAWTEYEKRVADDLGMPFELVQMFDRDYNNLYKNIGLDMFQRYILEPPEGKIGGHCIIPNAEILAQQYPDDLLAKIIDVGTKK